MRHTRTTLLLVVVLLFALAPAAWADPAQPTAPRQIYLPALFTAAATPAPSTIPFWAEQYTLSEGGCTRLHWKVQNAKDAFLDGAAVPFAGSRTVCPSNTQFFTLEVVRPDNTIAIYEVVLTEGEPFLLTDEVVAKGIVSSITLAADVDPREAGNQGGYQVGLRNVTKLWAFSPAGNEPTVTLGVPQAAVDLGEFGPLHWPLRIGQGVEFYAECNGPACLLDVTSWHYLFVTTE
jgi:hypothetical protein